MVALNVVQRFRHHNDQRSYRRKLAVDIEHAVIPRLLPALLTLPLTIIDSDGTTRRLDQTVQQAKYLTLAGTVGSGRMLALQQLAYQWANTDHAPVPLLIILPQIDDGTTAPAALLERVVAQTQPAPAKSGIALRGPSQPSLGLGERLAGWALLISGLEELPPHRQGLWRVFLQNAREQWTETRVVIAIQLAELPWDGFLPLRIAVPTPTLLREWIDHLIPSPRAELVHNMLCPGGALSTLAERLFEIVLLAIIPAHQDLPANRAELYSSAISVAFDLPSPSIAIEQVQLFAAYGEQPHTVVTGLLEPTAETTLRFMHPLFRDYFAARQLAAEERYDLLGELELGSRAELARFVVTMSLNPAPLYAILWGQGRPNAENILMLGACLRERPDTTPYWTLRIVGALALLARDQHARQHHQATALLAELMPTIISSLEVLTQANDQARRVIPQLLALLPRELALAHVKQRVYDAGINELLGWELADLLVNEHSIPPVLATQPIQPEARARWVYVHALGGPELRAQLAQVITGETITAVAQTAIGSARALQLGTVLIDDPALPETLRIASLNLLATNDQPTALTVIERACSDLDPDVRQAALAALLIRDAQRGRAALSRAALDTSTPLDARISAVEQLSQIFAEDSQLLLARCARDTTLPLYVQLLSVAGMPTSAFASLSEIVYDAAIHPAVRGIAALRLGSSADTNSSQTLRALLELSDTPHALAEGICAGLAASGRTDAAEPLLKLLQTSASDIELTISAIHALGELRAETATHTLVELVGGGALARLENLIPPGVIDQRVTDLLDTNELPPPLALRLATVYTKGVTPAEQPTTLREFLSYEVDAIRIASAQALAKIGGNTARAGLLSALIDNTVGNTAEHVMDALGRIDGETSAESLGYLATNTDINPMIRWLAVQQLRAHERGEAVMQRSLEQSDLDPFIRGALAEGLGQRRVITALPLLRQIADDSANDQHLRAQAIIGLGLLDEPAAEVVLIRLLSDAKEDVALRALAAEHLPSRLSTEGRRLLRELLRRERMPALIAAGALTVLGRAQDREALPLMLRYCQDERADVARAALKALAELGDASVAPVLVRVAQNPAAEQATRLQAIGTLLRIGGAAYRPLLRAYLEDGPLPLRLQALEHLIQASTSASELLAMVENTIFPLPLRLRLIHACIDRPEAGATLLRIAAQADELQLKVRAITALQHHGHLATSALVALAGDAPAPIRLAALEVLGKIGGTSACMALSTVVEDSTSPDTIRHYALSTLYTAVKRHIDENQSFHSVADKA